MVRRVIITFEDEVLEEIDKRAKIRGVSRNKYVAQICRNHVGFKSLLKEAEVVESRNGNRENKSLQANGSGR